MVVCRQDEHAVERVSRKGRWVGVLERRPPEVRGRYVEILGLEGEEEEERHSEI